MIPRRVFVGTLGVVALLAVSRRAHAQPPAKAARVGWLGRSAGRESSTFKAFAEGLRDLGYVVGDNLAIDVQTPDQDKVEQYPDVATRLVAAGVDVILASNPYAVEAAVKATKTIPVVGVDFESDPVAKGWVATLARPGGNVTGFFLDMPELSGKQLQLLKEVKPNLARVAVLGDARANEPQFRATEVAAQGAGLMLQRLPVEGLNEIPRALADAVRQRTGGLLAYGPAFLDPFRRAASYVDRILKGAQPGDLPVQRSTKFQFVVKPQDRQGHRTHDPTGAAAARGSHRRMTGLGFFRERTIASCTLHTIGSTMSPIRQKATPRN